MGQPVMWTFVFCTSQLGAAVMWTALAAFAGEALVATNMATVLAVVTRNLFIEILSYLCE
ncbi:hypothetical protein E1281_16715 [Actinomadura sp. KC345]|uniref:hypothetical protein n=1 Tax=Actinomadura sp. KC345 TaxID=2530371 RepID=UPI00104F2BFB|nr:hypothetical protein [Actinomadura sp. KC345]TDC54074.1 hypothetical protein E1281_16715 [Actinomadura sp. KC345]